MNFGLRIPSFALGPKTATLPEMGAYLRRAEDLGFDCAVSIDHLLLTPPAYACTWLEPVALLSALAGVTRTIKLGTMVLVLPLRNPAYFAKEWATLDVLSGGRSILGVGVGWHEEEFALMGVPHKERGRRMDEMLEAVTALWVGDRVTYKGKYYAFENLTIDPKPAQNPHPPIWIGGGTQPSEKIYAQTVANIDPVLRRIAKYAKTWVPHSSSTADMVRGDWDKIQRFMAEVGRKPGDISRVYSNFVWVLKKGERPESAIPHFKTFSGMDLPYWKDFYLLGEADEVAEKIREEGRDPRRLRVRRPQPAQLGHGAARAARRRSAAARGEALTTSRPLRYTGATVKRREDPRLLAGRGAYLDDLRPDGCLHAVFVRSPHAHARVLGVDARAARTRPGVAAVLTGHDLTGQVAPLAPRLEGEGFFATEWAALAPERVRFAGEPVAVVAAGDLYAAADAAEVVEVDYAPLPAVADVDTARARGAPACTTGWRAISSSSAGTAVATSTAPSRAPRRASSRPSPMGVSPRLRSSRAVWWRPGRARGSPCG